MFTQMPTWANITSKEGYDGMMASQFRDAATDIISDNMDLSSSSSTVELTKTFYYSTTVYEEPPTAANPADATSSSGDLVRTSQIADEFGEKFGRLVIDKDGGLHVGNRFWSVFCDELCTYLLQWRKTRLTWRKVDHIFQAVQEVADFNGELSDSITPETWSDRGGYIRSNQSFIFSNGQSVGITDDLNPLSSQMLFIWQAYVDDVDPFIKVLHVRSMEKIIRGLRGKFSSLGPAMEALLF
jgi:hypothetical protein